MEENSVKNLLFKIFYSEDTILTVYQNGLEIKIENLDVNHNFKVSLLSCIGGHDITDDEINELYVNIILPINVSRINECLKTCDEFAKKFYEIEFGKYSIVNHILNEKQINIYLLFLANIFKTSNVNVEVYSKNFKLNKPNYSVKI